MTDTMTMQCKICTHTSEKIFNHQLLDKYDVRYFFCKNCKFLQTEEPYWLEEAYKNPINAMDTGYLQRNNMLSKKVFVLFKTVFNKQSVFLDYAGGYGVFVRLMRDMGQNFLWKDLYCQNIFARGFEYEDQNIRSVTCFEAFEHFVNPLNELEKILAISKNIFFSTSLFPNSVPPDPEQWEYYGFDHGQHISLFSLETLQYIARKYGLYLYTNKKNIHFFSEKKYNALWLAFLDLLGLVLCLVQGDVVIRKLLGKNYSIKDQETLIALQHLK